MEQLKKWLDNKERAYKDGAAFFANHASVEQKRKFGAYIAAHDGSDATSMQILIGRIAFLVKAAGTSPRAMSPAADATLTKKPHAHPAVNTKSPANKIVAAKGKRHAAVMAELPPELAAEYKASVVDATKVIGALHADLHNEGIETERARAIAAELLHLEAERKIVLDKVDAWLTANLK